MKKLYFILFSIPLLTSCISGGKGSQLNGSSRCLPPNIIIKEDLTWTEEDNKILIKAYTGCIKFFGSRSCVKEFRKIDKHAYNVLCSKNHNSVTK